jgi:DNA-binding transcriptional MerR regulator
MPFNVGRLPSRGGARLYSSDREPLLQWLLTTLADIDFAFESDLEVVKNSATDDVLKRKILERLQKQHRERRAPYVRQIAALQQNDNWRKSGSSTLAARRSA